MLNLLLNASSFLLLCSLGEASVKNFGGKDDVNGIFLAFYFNRSFILCQ